MTESMPPSRRYGPQTQRFVEWFEEEKAAERLVDVKFYLDLPPNATVEEVFEDLMALMDAPADSNLTVFSKDC